MRKESPTLSTKVRILAAATEGFAEHGPEGVVIRDIAHRVGITPMAIYRHFKDKEEMFLAVLQQGFDAYADYLKPLEAINDPVEHLRWLAARVFDFSVDHRAHFELMFLSSRTPEGLSNRSEIQAIHAPTYRIAREALSAVQATGRIEVEDLPAQTREMLSYCIGFCALFLSGGFRLSTAAARSRYLKGFDRHLGL